MKQTPHDIQEYLKPLTQIRLKEDTRAHMAGELLAHASFHQVKEGVRVGEDSRSIEQVPPGTFTVTQFLNLNFMTLAIIIAIILGGGTTLAAEQAMPGDFLYAVKTEVNENVKSAFAIGADAEAELQAELLAERVMEAETLEADGELSAENIGILSARMKVQVVEAREAFDASSPTVALASREQARMSVEQFNVLVNNDSVYAIDVDSMFSSEGAIASDLQTEPIDMAAFGANTISRVEGLRQTIANAEGNISASVRTEMNTKLDQAVALMANVETRSEAEIEEALMSAAGLAGEVESQLSLLGTVQIDTNTGSIIDIDFGGDATSTDEDTATSNDADASASGSADVDVQTSGAGASGSVQGSTGLSL